MYGRGRKGKKSGRRKRKDSNDRNERYRSSDFRLVCYGPPRDRSPAWERDCRNDRRRSGDRRRRRRGRSRSHSPRRRSKSPKDRRGSKSPKGRKRSKSPKDRRRSKSPKDRKRSKSPKDRKRSRSPKPRRRSKSPEIQVEEKEVLKRLKVENIDFHIPENTKNHRTNQFACTQERKRKTDGKLLKPELVVRRGQIFCLSIEFDREYDEIENDLEFNFTIGQNPRPAKGTAAEVDLDENPDGTINTIYDDWYAELKQKTGKKIKVEITSPCNCIIGEWNFSILTFAKEAGSKPLIWKYICNQDITILLNPWCEHDACYLSKTELLNEYVLLDSGCVYQGNYKQVNAKIWNFAQFEEDILDICLSLVRKSFNGKYNITMGDPVNIARNISRIVNYDPYEEMGVLIGNWSGEYEDGTHPTIWSSSKGILNRYWKEGAGVKFGQCWVFSAITTTVCRAIGLPCRSVTNFCSAHDSDGSVAIDYEYVRDKNGKLKKLPGDSVWNFHVWNEVWMSRDDLGMGTGYDGWQAIDATPQELSGGEYRCGPAPIVAIKRGNLDRMKYDCPFVFAEVNADIIKWEKLSDTKWKKISVDSRRVGKKISTKRPDGKPYTKKTSILIWEWDDDADRLDITDQYKYKEGTIEERLAVQNANRASVSERDVEESEHQDVFITVSDKDGIMYGENFDVEVKLKNQSEDKKPRTVTDLDISVNGMTYTGDECGQITDKKFENIRLDFNEEHTEIIKITPDDYLGRLVEGYMMSTTAIVRVKETKKIHMAEEEYRLRRPDLDVKAPSSAEINKPFEIEVSFKNPLDAKLTGCKVMVEGNGIEDIELTVDPVGPKSYWKQGIKIEPLKKGSITLNVAFDCKEIIDVAGYKTVVVD